MIDHGGSLTNNPAQRRHAVRRKMFEPVVLHFDGIAARAHFLDLSCSGALAHSETPPAGGRHISVEAVGLERSGRVMWVKGKRFGIQFSQPLSDADVAALIRGA